MSPQLNRRAFQHGLGSLILGGSLVSTKRANASGEGALASQQAADDDAADNDVFEDRAAPAATIVAEREVGQRLHELVDALPNQTAQLIRTIYFEGATLQEAATRLGISKSWASRLHARTLQQLAASLRKLGAAD